MYFWKPWCHIWNNFTNSNSIKKTDLSHHKSLHIQNKGCAVSVMISVSLGDQSVAFTQENQALGSGGRGEPYT